MKPLLAAFLFIISLDSFGQIDFRKEIDNIYNFHPHQLSETEQQDKFPLLDKLFDMIKSDTSKYLPLLRQELNSNDHFPYFYYDCSHLLMLLSHSQSDKALCAKAFAKCNVKDLNPQIYVVLLKSLATANIDVTKAAIKILEDPDFHFYLIEHGGFDFNQGYCLTYCLLALDPTVYTKSLIEYFQSTKDTIAQKSIITALWFSYSCAGDEFLHSLNTGQAIDKGVVTHATKLLGDNKLDGDYKKLLRKINPDELEEMKKSGLQRFSDEAIDDLAFVTKARRQKLNCR